LSWPKLLKHLLQKAIPPHASHKYSRFGNGASLIKLIWARYLDPDYVRSPCLGAIWNFFDEQVLPNFGIRLWGTKGLF